MANPQKALADLHRKQRASLNRIQFVDLTAQTGESPYGTFTILPGKVSPIQALTQFILGLEGLSAAKPGVHTPVGQLILKIVNDELAKQGFPNDFVRRDGTTPLTDDWDVGPHSLTVGGDVDIVGTLTASGMTYPTSSGGAGEVLVSDGAANLVFQGFTPLNVKYAGAVGNGVVDDTAAIQAAIDSAASGDRVVLFPAGTYRVTSTLNVPHNNLALIAETGAGAEVMLDAPGSPINLFNVTGDGVTFRGLGIRAGDTTLNLETGNGIHATGAHRLTIRSCAFSGGRGTSLYVRDADDCIIESNRFTTSFMSDGDSTTENGPGTDITLAYSTRRCTIRGNVITSGMGIGIRCITLAAGNECTHHVIEGNILQGSKLHGIALYRTVPGALVEQCAITGNTISDVLGSLVNAGGDKVFGIGIYLRAAERCTISNNTLSRTSVQSDLQTLPISAIGLNELSSVVVSGNVIHDAYGAGIFASQQSALGESDGVIQILGNNIRNTGLGGVSGALDGIHVVESTKAIIQGNSVFSPARHGITVSNVVQGQSLIIDGNKIFDAPTTGNCIQLFNIEDVSVTKNHVSGGAVGVFSLSLINVLVEGNNCSDHVSQGIRAGGGTGKFQALGNMIRQTVTGILCEAGNGLLAHNRVFDCTVGINPTNTYELVGNHTLGNSTALSGTFRPSITGATPAVFQATNFTLQASATPVTNFTEAYTGQEIVIEAEGNVTVSHVPGTLELREAVDFTMVAGDILVLKRVTNSLWQEMSRKAGHFDNSGAPHVTGTVAGSGGIEEFEFALPYPRATGILLEVTATGDTTSTHIEMFRDAARTELVYQALSKDAFTQPFVDGTPFTMFRASGLLEANQVYFRITNNGANPSEYEVVLVTRG